MKKSLCVLISILSSVSLASTYGFGVGVRSDSATSNTTTTNIGTQSDYMAGVVAQIDLVGQLQVRTGFFYSPRSYQYNPLGGPSGLASFTYMDVPVGILWKLSDFGGPFVGANVALNVSSSCPANCTGVQSTPAGWQLGAQFKFMAEWGAALYYESMSAIMTGIDQPKAFVGQLYYMF